MNPYPETMDLRTNPPYMKNVEPTWPQPTFYKYFNIFNFLENIWRSRSLFTTSCYKGTTCSWFGILSQRFSVEKTSFCFYTHYVDMVHCCRHQEITWDHCWKAGKQEVAAEKLQENCIVKIQQKKERKKGLKQYFYLFLLLIVYGTHCFTILNAFNLGFRCTLSITVCLFHHPPPRIGYVYH